MRFGIASVLALLVAAQAHGAGDLPHRQVTAPPEDISAGFVRLPDPASAAISSTAAWVAIALERAVDGTWVWEADFPVGASGPLDLAWIAADALEWRIAFGPRTAPPRPLEQWLAGGGIEYRAGFERELGAQRIELASARAGTWRVRVEADRAGEGWLAYRDSGAARLASHPSTFATLAGSDVAMLASLHDGGHDSPLLDAQLESIELVVDLDGRELREPMLDVGLHADGAAGDGVFGAYLPAGLAGEQRLRVEARGTTSAGESFLRVTHHRVDLVARDLELLPHASTSLDPDGRTRIALDVELARERGTLLVAAELWGKSSDGRDVPICWLARLTEPQNAGGRWSLPLALDARWVALAAARPPFALREARVQDPGTNVVLDRVARIELGEILLAPASPAPDRPTWSMLGAPAGSSSLPTGAPIPPRSTTRALLLVHGYCSGGGVWPPADFSPPKREFLDPDADRTNDEFAQIMLAQTSDLGSFGVVAHSQGGLAALQLLTYYVSGLDYASGPRRIQSVASPYQGTPLAAFAATCGTHNDLTPDEAAVWLSTIPSWARAEVHYRTVSDSSTACNFFTDFLLSDPEDGVVERSRGQLPGGNSMGHVTGWCHTTGMSDPACYSDHARNQEMDANAAR